MQARTRSPPRAPRAPARGSSRIPRRSPEPRGEPLDRRAHLAVQLLERARHADGPALVPEVTLDLADDVRRGVRRERHLARELVAVDRLDQADRADLLDVVERLAAAGVAARQRANERQVALDERLARARVTFLVVALEQLAVGERRRGDVHLEAHDHQLPRTAFSSRTTRRPAEASSTPYESTTVERMRGSVSSPGPGGGPWSAMASAVSRSGPTRVRTPPSSSSNESVTGSSGSPSA